MQSDPDPSPLNQFLADFREFWRRLSNKGLFLGLLAAWVVLFHLGGNSTFGYIDTSSLFLWLYNAYNAEGSDDGLGLLMPFVVVGLIWWKRDTLLRLPQAIWWPGLVLLALALLLHVAGYMLQQPRLSAVAFFAGLYVLLGLVFGVAWMKVTFFPHALLAFCIPVSSLIQQVSFPLRLLATKITAAISQTGLGIHVVRDGTRLLDMNGTYSYDVDVACSGIRSLIAILALSMIYGYIAFKSNWRRAVMIGLAIPLAVAGNVFRLTTIIIAAEAFGQSAGNYVHESSLFSLLPYVPAFIAVIALGHWLAEREPANKLQPTPA